MSLWGIHLELKYTIKYNKKSFIQKSGGISYENNYKCISGKFEMVIQFWENQVIF